MGHAKIYSFDPATDGWKTFPGAETKTIKIDMKMRGIREADIAFTHYCKGGAALCGLPEASGASFYNDVRNQCDGCRAGLRKQTIKDKALFDACEAGEITEEEAEKDNVIDYKAAEKLDHPETAKVGH